MITDKVRELLKKYIKLCSWFLVREDDKSVTTEQFEIVLNEIGSLETQLLDNGVSEKALDGVISYLKENLQTNKPINEMTDVQQLRVFKAIFGEGTHWSK